MPPPLIVSCPAADSPTCRFVVVAPGVPITVGLGAVVSSLASLPPPGTPFVQFPAVNQSVEVVPVQTVCANAGSLAAHNTIKPPNNFACRNFIVPPEDGFGP
ncbi:hypothetical protein G8O24_10675 [Bradyrhizobium sp. INPA01-394B]|uniref:DUF4150 domain-containing protein n=1 Tax=Bradyrhizobium campsiandrae TaxID=1729892 RepID=A0ABR7U2L5_9BRAD|nr:hypothetical protein [Bradyrhizobium campsiandrae]MBC9877803.1 hypothetical protein [Bradyrhizobium campsiandrae]MBC9977642.1 hypothetical protein [Bradyrhizobium campsiandrae]